MTEPNTITIIVKNITGSAQDYRWFSSAPSVSGDYQREIWSTVLKTANHVPDHGTAEVRIDLWKYYAICGFSANTPSPGTRVNVTTQVPVTLGTKDDGNFLAGSTVNLSVEDGATSCGLELDPVPAGYVGSFAINTPGNFTLLDATNNNLFVGFSSSQDGENFTTLGTFTPAPSTKYQISPSHLIHVAAGNSSLNPGMLIRTQDIQGVRISLDFTNRKFKKATLVHGADGSFTFNE